MFIYSCCYRNVHKGSLRAYCHCHAHAFALMLPNLMDIGEKVSVFCELYDSDCHKHSCANCLTNVEKERREFKMCRLCKQQKLRVRAFYCSLECAKDHWTKGHRQFHSLLS